MKISYRKTNFLISLEKPVTFKIHPLFIIRSVLGKELRRLVCIFRDRECAGCSLKYTCAYSWMFETPIEKTNEILFKRDRASHPFILSCNRDLGFTGDKLDLGVTAFGKGVDYLPYLYYSLQRAGQKGIFTERVPFIIEDAQADGAPILEDDGYIDVMTGRKEWVLGSSREEGETQRLRVAFLTPLRLKVNGRYTSDFSFDDFLLALERRAVILSSLYGDDSEDNFIKKEKNGSRIISRNLKWMDLDYYSARQGVRMKLGGITGDFIVTGPFSSRDLSLLSFGEIFHVGKNAGFGLGRMTVTPMNNKGGL